MITQHFITIEPNPTTVKSAIDLLSTVIKQQKNEDLLLKVGAIQGAYAVYERTADVSILEHLIIDIILLFKDVVSPARATRVPASPDLFGEGRTDLLYMQPADSCMPTISTDTLIKNFLQTLTCSDNTRSNYLACLRKLFKDMGVSEVRQNDFPELIKKIKSTIEDHHEYNHNIRSGANGLIKYLLGQAGVQQEQ